MQILGLFGMYFDAVVVEVKTFSLSFKLALAILCQFASAHNCTQTHAPAQKSLKIHSYYLAYLSCLCSILF